MADISTAENPPASGSLESDQLMYYTIQVVKFSDSSPTFHFIYEVHPVSGRPHNKNDDHRTQKRRFSASILELLVPFRC